MTKTNRRKWVKKVFLDTRHQFWGFQITGWLLLAFLTYFSLTYLYHPTELAYALHPLLQSAIGVVVSWPMRGLFHYAWDKKLIVRVSVLIVAVFVFSFIWTVLRLGSFILMTSEEKDFLPEFGGWYFPGVLVFFAWAVLYHGIKYYRLLQEEHASLLKVSEEKKAVELKGAQAEAFAKEAQLKMLRYQLNPHFLFNTMNAVTSLIKTGRSESASKTIDQLSSFLRKSLDSDPLQAVTLEQEIETLRLYLEIEQTRFADRLKLEFDIDDDALTVGVPSLLLQPLAENAIKHAIAPAIDGGTIRVTASLTRDYLELAIEDSGSGSDRDDDSLDPQGGVGLSNTRDRLQTIYGGQYKIKLEPGQLGGLRVVLQIPQECEIREGTIEAVSQAHA